MKKIPTLFEREFSARKVIGITDKVHPGCEWVLDGLGTPTEKIDGACCAILGGSLYKRYDAKKGKKPPKGAIPCQDEPDPVTGHWPHWVKVNPDDPADKWFWAAYCNSPWVNQDGTYEAVGVHFQGNPYGLDDDFLEKHGRIHIFGLEPTFDGIKAYLSENEIEGIVWWFGGEPRCKIKRTDFGFKWPVKNKGKEDGNCDG